MAVTTLTYKGKPFTQLGAVVNGRTGYCTNCVGTSPTPSVCAGGGAGGSWYFGQNNQWMCSSAPNVLAQLPNYIGPINMSGNQTNGGDQINSVCLNGECPVTAFGAKGNCSFSGPTASCFDNHDSIQAAINYAYAHGLSIYFPGNPGATGTPNPGSPPFYSLAGQTIYYTSSAINPEGVSMHGPVGSKGTRWTIQPLVGVRGAPGKDVFSLTDVGASGYVYPLTTFTVSDLGIIVDDTVDTHTAFPNRIVGRICNDAFWANGSNVVTSSGQCFFAYGDIGQTILIGGQSSLVSAWNSPTSVQITSTNTTGADIGGQAEIGAYRFPANQTVGNCGWAYNEATSANVEGVFGSTFRNVTIITTDNQAGMNSTCGMYFQGNAYLYQTHFDNMNITGAYGFVFGNSMAPTSSLNAGLGDYNHFDQVWVLANYPWISYNGSFNSIHGMQISYAKYGAQIYAAFGLEPYPGYWDIDIPEFECNAAPACPTGAGANGFRISGLGHKIGRLRVGYFNPNAGVPVSVEWEADGTYGGPILGALVNPWVFTGSNNNLYVSEEADQISNIQDKSRGGNNLYAGHYSAPIGGAQPSRERAIGTINSTIGNPQIARQGFAFTRTHDFLTTGEGNYFYMNGEDLWYWPKDLITSTNAPPIVIADGSSDTGDVATITANTSFVGSINAFWQVPIVPSIQSILYVKAIGASGTVTGNISVTDPTGTTIYGTRAVSFASGTYTTVQVPANLALLGPGSRIYINFSSLSGQLNIAWLGWRPLPHEGIWGGPGQYWGTPGPPILACTPALATQYACVQDATAGPGAPTTPCAASVTYATGGSTHCKVQCNQAGNAWVQDGTQCY